MLKAKDQELSDLKIDVLELTQTVENCKIELEEYEKTFEDMKVGLGMNKMARRQLVKEKQLLEEHYTQKL